MRKRKRAWQLTCELIAATTVILICLQVPPAKPMLMLTTNCLTSAPSCVCTWKGGKFVAECSGQSLHQVPKVSFPKMQIGIRTMKGLHLTNIICTIQNDYDDFLVKNAGNNQMQTLNRDIQQLNLSTNNITQLESGEFFKKKYRNLQKIFINDNQIASIDSDAFDKLTGLIELDLSENQLHNNDRTGVRHRTESHANDEQDNHNMEDYEVGFKDDNTNQDKLSFLRHLTQLRQLNLASNHLSRLDKFTFSQLTQLRQLSLSR